MSKTSCHERRGITRIELVVIVALLLLCGGMFGFWPGAVVIFILFGWIIYPFEVTGEITVEPVAVVTSGLAILLFIVGVYFLGKWFVRETSATETPRRWTFSHAIQLMFLVLFAFVAGTSMIGIAHQITWLASTDEKLLESSYQPARRSASKNNLKQIGLAIHNYHDTHDFFATSTLTPDGRAHHSWQTYLLPFIDQEPLYEKIDTDLPWKHPDNRPFFLTTLEVYQNPGFNLSKQQLEEQPAQSHYAGNGRVLRPNQKTGFRDITDGTSNTLLSGEVRSHFKAWGNPTNLRDPALGINKYPHGFGGPFKGGSQFVLVDGAVRFISEDIDQSVIKALATPAGGEEIPYDAY